jgi:hypothetical protein
VEVQVEKSSGDRTLDAAAVTAARTWHLPPQTDAQGVAMASKVRVPVKFDPDAGGPNPKATSRSRPRDGFFVARRAMQAKSPALLADGRVTGFVADEYPIGVASIGQAVDMLDRYGERHADPEPVVKQYSLLDEEGISYWYLIADPSEDGRGLYRQRAVSDGKRGFWVTSYLCEPADSEMCGRFKQFVTGFGPQDDMPPPPPPPPPKPEGS